MQNIKAAEWMNKEHFKKFNFPDGPKWFSIIMKNHEMFSLDTVCLNICVRHMEGYPIIMFLAYIKFQVLTFRRVSTGHIFR